MEAPPPIYEALKGALGLRRDAEPLAPRTAARQDQSGSPQHCPLACSVLPPEVAVTSSSLPSEGNEASSSSRAASPSNSPSYSSSMEAATVLLLFLGEALLGFRASTGMGSSHPSITGLRSWLGSGGFDRKAAKFANTCKAKMRLNKKKKD